MRYIFIDKRFIVKYIKLNQKDVVFFDNKCIENISFHFILTLPIPFHKFIRSHTIYIRIFYHDIRFDLQLPSTKIVTSET